MMAVQIRSLLHQPMRELAARRSIYEVSRSPVQSGRKHRTDRLDMRGYFELI